LGRSHLSLFGATNEPPERFTSHSSERQTNQPGEQTGTSVQGSRPTWTVSPVILREGKRGTEGSTSRLRTTNGARGPALRCGRAPWTVSPVTLRSDERDTGAIHQSLFGAANESAGRANWHFGAREQTHPGRSHRSSFGKANEAPERFTSHSSERQTNHRASKLALRCKGADPPWTVSPVILRGGERDTGAIHQSLSGATNESAGSASIHFDGSSRFQEEFTVHFGGKRTAGLHHRSCRDTEM